MRHKSYNNRWNRETLPVGVVLIWLHSLCSLRQPWHFSRMSEKFLVKQMEGHQTVQGAQVQACSPTGQVGDVVRFFLSATISAGFVKGALTCFSYLLLSSSALCIVICSCTWSFVYGDIDIEWFLSLHWSYKLWYDMETYIFMCFLFGWTGAPLLHCILDSGKILVLIFLVWFCLSLCQDWGDTNHWIEWIHAWTINSHSKHQEDETALPFTSQHTAL